MMSGTFKRGKSTGKGGIPTWPWPEAKPKNGRLSARRGAPSAPSRREQSALPPQRQPPAGPSPRNSPRKVGVGINSQKTARKEEPPRLAHRRSSYVNTGRLGS